MLALVNGFMAGVAIYQLYRKNVYFLFIITFLDN